MTYKEFENCDDSNGDGIGFGFNKKGKQYYVKGFMDLESAWEFYKKLPEKVAHVVHFRLGTAGGNIPQLTHPFICDERSPLFLEHTTEKPLLFHNGMALRWEMDAETEKIPVHNYMSDTRMLAILLGKYGIENKKTILRPSYGKFIILDKGKATLMGEFIYDKGVYFSNNNFKYSFKSLRKKSYIDKEGYEVITYNSAKKVEDKTEIFL
jgi:predicted glutamine amidotransferase